MSVEAYEVSYQGNTNERFKDALLDHVMQPAYEWAQRSTALNEHPGSDTLIELRSVRQYEETAPIFEYTVYVARGVPRLDILVSTHFRPGDMTWQEAESLRLEMLERHGVEEQFRDELRTMTAADLLETATLSYVNEARYEIDLIDRTLSATTELSCMINGMRFLLSGSSTELDEDRQMVFDAEEVVDIIRALHSTALIEDSQVREFLNIDF
jgi:hypothetical protein